jgi:hypothetical protein
VEFLYFNKYLIFFKKKTSLVLATHAPINGWPLRPSGGVCGAIRSPNSAFPGGI